MELFEAISKDWKLLKIILKSFILDFIGILDTNWTIWQSTEQFHANANTNNEEY